MAGPAIADRPARRPPGMNAVAVGRYELIAQLGDRPSPAVHVVVTAGGTARADLTIG